MFNVAAIAALLLSVLVHILQARGMLPGPFLIFCNIAIMTGLVVAAMRQRKATHGAFDTAVAAETVVAYGVLALILGLASALYPLLTSSDPIKFDPDTVRTLSAPFLQGLVTAALAPVIAVILRSVSANDDPEPDQLANLAALQQAFADLSIRLDETGRQADALKAGLHDAVVAVAKMGLDLDKSIQGIVAVTNSFAPALDKGLTAAVGSLNQGAQNLGQHFVALDAQIGQAVSGCRAGLEQLGTTASSEAAQIKAMAAEFEKLRGSAADTAELLTALNAMILSVEQFVAARSTKP